jgi:adenosylcobinamide-GDP ribazoletransferase
MIATVLLTGAFHEDGLADTCDAFGGGWSKEKILEIMKDSRIGTYGTVGLIFILLTKYFCLTSVSVEQIPFVLFAAHALSRYTATGMIFFSEYARDDATSKTKPVGKELSSGDFLLALIFGSTPLLLLSINYSYWYLLIFISIVPIIYFLKRYFEKWIGGFSGDGLGATQQVSEIAFYITFIIINNLI